MLVNRGEEFSDIALQYPQRVRVVAGRTRGIYPKLVKCFVRSFSISARIRVKDKCLVKERVELAVERMMYQPIAYARFMDVAWLRVAYFKVVVSAVPICVLHKFSMQLQNVLHQISFKFLHIFSFSLSLYELSPRVKQVFYRDDILVCKTP